MFPSISTFLFCFFLYPLSSSHPQADGLVTLDSGGKISFKIGGLSFQVRNSSITSTRFLLYLPFQWSEIPCLNLPTVFAFGPECAHVFETAAHLNDNGYICQGDVESRGSRSSATWFTCDDYTKPTNTTGDTRVSEEKKQWLRWRISNVKDGVYTTDSTPIHKSLSDTQLNVKAFYSAKLEIVKGIVRRT
jgi:hypothetical protein